MLWKKKLFEESGFPKCFLKVNTVSDFFFNARCCLVISHIFAKKKSDKLQMFFKLSAGFEKKYFSVYFQKYFSNRPK
jgi:hypothetical protein